MKPAARQACDQQMEKVAKFFVDVEDVDEDDVSDVVFDDLAGVWMGVGLQRCRSDVRRFCPWSPWQQLDAFLCCDVELDLGSEQAGELAEAKAAVEEWSSGLLAGFNSEDGRAVCYGCYGRSRSAWVRWAERAGRGLAMELGATVR